MRSILSVAMCLLFLISAAIAEDAVNGVSLGIGDSTTGSNTGVDIIDPPSDNNLNTGAGGLPADNDVNLEPSDLSSGEDVGVEVCDSLSGSCFLVDDSAEMDAIEANRLTDNIMADTQIDLQAEGIDARVLQIASHNVDSNVDMNNSAVDTVHVSWLSKDTTAENLTCVLSIEKFLQIWGNSTSGVTGISQRPSM